MTFILPRSLMITNRKETKDLNLSVIEGKLPDDIDGFAFFMVPSGDCEDNEESNESNGTKKKKAGSPILGGDGMVIRLDFSTKGNVIFHSMFAKSESFHLDEFAWNTINGKSEELSTNKITPKIVNLLKRCRFKDFGLGRLNFRIGIRNSLNTAITPLKFKDQDYTRLLVCSDDGRPYELDPLSLKTVTPVGRLDEWTAIMGNGMEVKVFGIKLIKKKFRVWLFPLIMSTAHPVLDPKTSELFSVNYGRSFRDTIHNSTVINQRVTNLREAFWLLVKKGPKGLAFLILSGVFLVIDFFSYLLRGRNTKVFTDLIRWDGKGDLEKFNLILPSGKPVLIKETLHQIAITEKHILLIDAAFKFTLDQIVNSIRPFRLKNNQRSRLIERLIRHIITAPMDTDTRYYIVSREDLDLCPLVLQNKFEKNRDRKFKKRYRRMMGSGNKVIVAKPFNLPFETMHFMTDYKESDGKITMHLSHNNAACVAEWLRPYDRNVEIIKAGNGKSKISRKDVPEELWGMMAVGQMDVSRIQKVVLDPLNLSSVKTMTLLSLGESGIQDSSNHENTYNKETIPNTFNLSFYAYKGQTTVTEIPEKIDHIYWMCGGLFPEALTEYIYRMYKDYEYRTIPIDLMNEISKVGKPSNLVRVNNDLMEIEDFYIFDKDVVGMSPIFVPKREEEGGQMDGYIVCTVYFDLDCGKKLHSQFWIFDGQDLRKGPICKLGHEKAEFGLSLHTAWIKEAKSLPNGSYKISIREDLNDRLESKGSAFRKLFEDHIFPKFENGV